ncbi:hypothetical protein [Agathobacter rectalis]|nr:hypothetical protein [Agathobacter rectalis]
MKNWDRLQGAGFLALRGRQRHTYTLRESIPIKKSKKEIKSWQFSKEQE